MTHHANLNIRPTPVCHKNILKILLITGVQEVKPTNWSENLTLTLSLYKVHTSQVNSLSLKQLPFNYATDK